MDIDEAVKEHERKKQTQKQLKEQKKAAGIAKANEGASRVTVSRSEDGVTMSFRAMPFLHRFIGFGLNGFWFAFCTAIIIPIYGIAIFITLLKNVIPDVSLRFLAAMLLDFSAFVYIYAVFIFLRYPPIRILITNNNHYAIYTRNSTKPKVIGEIYNLHFSTHKKNNGYGTFTLSGKMSREYSRLNYNDIQTIDDFARNNSLRS
ncbi:MAG: hypothetical protein KAS64_07665 [Spirochaetes bacterium]|nr:hypothetical protein [Spirochaetota bacterium]